MKNIVIVIIALFVLASCRKSEGPDFYKEIAYNFNENMQGWKVMFSDYPVGEEDFYELHSSVEKLPLPLDTSLYAVMITGNNHSDDLFTYMYIPITGLAAHKTYKTTFVVNLASNIATNSVGIGGSPNLALGVGAIDTVPVNIIDDANYYRPNFEVELQSSESNEIMQVIGTIGVAENTSQYTAISRNNLSHPMEFTSNGNGTLYVLCGWDSGFEGITKIYIKSIIIRFEQVSD